MKTFVRGGNQKHEPCNVNTAHQTACFRLACRDMPLHGPFVKKCYEFLIIFTVLGTYIKL